MHRLGYFLVLFAPMAAHAQGSPTQAQIDEATGSVTRQVNDFGRQIAIDQMEIRKLQQQLSAATAEKDKLKADAEKRGTKVP